MKYAKLFSFAVVLFAVAASTHAQQCPGYDPTMYQSPNPGDTSGYNPPSPCAGQGIFSTAAFFQTNSTTDFCGSLSTGGQLTKPSTITGYGVASCTPVVLYCYPIFDLEVTVASNQQDYNRFYNRAYDSTYTSSACVTNSTVGFHQDYWQCGWYSCPPPPGGGGGSGGGCTRVMTCTEGYSWDNIACDCEPDASPIILDVNGNGFFLTNAANGVQFDIAGNGRSVQMGWTAFGTNNAFLALPGPDGLVHGGKQLFGNFTPQPASQNPNGFAALAVYVDPKNGGNGNGMIDSGDGVFASLRLWIDANHDGISQPEGLHTLASLGVNSISLMYKADRRTDQ